MFYTVLQIYSQFYRYSEQNNLNGMRNMKNNETDNDAMIKKLDKNSQMEYKHRVYDFIDDFHNLGYIRRIK